MSVATRLERARAEGRTYVVAEAGSNHNTEWELAVRLVEAAAAAGVDAIKFQAFRAERLYPRQAGAADYLGTGEDIYELVARMELPEGWLPRLADATADRAIDLLVTAFDEVSAEAVEPFVPAHKIASYELTYGRLIRQLAKNGKPLFISTGAATLEEVDAAVGIARAAGVGDLTLLQCTASYPASPEALNVSAMNALRTCFSTAVGLSDHSLDPVVAPVLAVAYSAAVIEKHFTLDRALPGPDHAFALEPHELAQMVAAVRTAELARGDGQKRVHEEEAELRAFARRFIFATRDLRPGDTVTEGSVAVLRAGKRGSGLAPDDYERLIGRRVLREIATGAPVQSEDIEWAT
jgi:sialic acid synthase SpsE